MTSATELLPGGDMRMLKLVLELLFLNLKKVLQQNLDEIRVWFAEAPSDENDIETVAYVLQAYDAAIVWSQIIQDVGRSICGQAPKESLKELFPSIVTDEYLIQHTWAKEFLNPLKPAIISGLKEICREKPDDPVKFLSEYLTRLAAE